MRIRSNKRLLGLMLTPFALFSACVGLTPEEQAEYTDLQSEVRRIQDEEITPRQQQLHEILEGGLVLDINDLNEKVNQIRNEKLGPLEHQLSGLQSGEQVLAAPGTRIELEELNRRLEELGLLSAGLEGQISEYREQLEAAKSAASHQVEQEITVLEVERHALLEQLEDLFRDTDLRAAEIDASLAELRQALEVLDPDSTEAREVRSGIAEFEAEWETLHDNESALKAEIEATVGRIEAEIAALREESAGRSDVLAEQFGVLIHGLEISLHDVSEEKEDAVRRIHEIELSGPEELQEAIAELENLIEEIVTSELRPLIERINQSVAGEDADGQAREQLRVELEDWLATIASKRARMNELNSKSFQSLLQGLNLGGLPVFGQ